MIAWHNLYPKVFILISVPQYAITWYDIVQLRFWANLIASKSLGRNRQKIVKEPHHIGVCITHNIAINTPTMHGTCITHNLNFADFFFPKKFAKNGRGGGLFLAGSLLWDGNELSVEWVKRAVEGIRFAWAHAQQKMLQLIHRTRRM
jgi:hypothetical protein